MYFLDHFGLKDQPFALTPDSRLFFDGADRRDILASLLYAVKRGDGLLKVTGEVGSGKTMLCRIMLRMLMEEAHVAYLNAPPGDRNHLLAAICREFQLPEGDADQMMNALNEFLLDVHANGERAVLIVDEAQALGAEGLETMRLITNLETDRDKLIQVVLFGQPELDALLGKRGLRQLAQRVTFSFNTRLLGLMESEAYIRHRLHLCAVDGRSDHVRPPALRLLARAATGNPRMINVMADKAMLNAYGEGRERVTVRDVMQAVTECRVIGARLPVMARPWVRRTLWAGGAVAGLALAVAGGLVAGVLVLPA